MNDRSGLDADGTDAILGAWAELAARAGRPAEAPRPRSGSWPVRSVRTLGALAVIGAVVLAFVVSAPTLGPDRLSMAGSASPSPELSTCPVTLPNGVGPTGQEPSALFHGVDGLSTILWPDGVVPVLPDDIVADGTTAVTFPFFREGAAHGALAVTARRPGEPPRLIRVDISDGYGVQGIQATTLHLPAGGCWVISAASGTATLQVVVALRRAEPSPIPVPTFSPDGSCPVTEPNGVAPRDARIHGPITRSEWPYWYGVDGLMTKLGEGGVTVINPRLVDADGHLGEKSGFYREGIASGSLTIEGRRLDDGAPLRAQVPDGYGPTGLQVAGISFPGEGCHAVTVMSGRAVMTYVTIVRIGDEAGPPG